MNFTISEFRDITFVIFFLYIFYETKIYLAIWMAVFHLLSTGIKLFFSNNITIYKVTISVYVVAVLVGYLYKFRHVLSSKKKPVNNTKLKNLSTDKTKRLRIGIAILLLLIVNIAAIFIFERGQI